MFSESLLIESSRNSGIWHVTTTSGLSSTHWWLSEAFSCWRNISCFSEWNILLSSTVASSWVESLLLHWGISWLWLNVGWWLVLWVNCLIMRLRCWHSYWWFAVWCSFHRLGHSESTLWCSFDTWSLSDSLSWNELFTLWDRTKLLLSIVGNVLFILSLLFS